MTEQALRLALAATITGSHQQYSSIAYNAYVTAPSLTLFLKPKCLTKPFIQMMSAAANTQGFTLVQVEFIKDSKAMTSNVSDFQTLVLQA